MQSIWDRANPQLRDLAVYQPGKPIEETARELGCEPSEIIKLASNENPIGPSPKAIEVMRDAIENAHLYPDGGAFYLRNAIAQKLDVTPDHILLGNGSNEIIELLAHAFLERGDAIVTSEHAFVAYKIIARVFGAETIEAPSRDYGHDLDAMLDAITDRTELIFIANPNNPTGTYVTAAEVSAFLRSVPPDVIVVFDEAYYEYVTATDYPDTLAVLASGRNIVVLRTFSKIYGLAGLRIGYGVTTAEIVGHLNRIRPPFNTNSPAQKAALAALEDEEHVQESRRGNIEGRHFLMERLRALGFTVVPSEANFLYFDARKDGKPLFDALLRQGVIVRHLGGTCLRVTVGLPHENRRFIDALQSVLSQKKENGPP